MPTNSPAADPDLTPDCKYDQFGRATYCQGCFYGQQGVGVWQDPNDPTHVTVNGPGGQAGHSDFGYFYKPEGGGTEFPNYGLSRNKDPYGNPITFPNPWEGRFGPFKVKR
ncbi:hypothetical protein Slin15195_G118780 [Septoria linicola]|uniref:Uncharacterized protein n=1 Tax=Septoria linicola TaxID=215465 RepID=A0A9Q9EQA2_9PEZI|nr:hypothetical protein Slin15195_G118780 [Septoria linicola]